MSICIHVYTCIDVYVYIYIYRERERIMVHDIVYMSCHTCMYIWGLVPGYCSPHAVHGGLNFRRAFRSESNRRLEPFHVLAYRNHTLYMRVMLLDLAGAR